MIKPPRGSRKSSPKHISIQDPRDIRLSPYRNLKGKMLEKEGVFIAEGEKVVRSMLKSSCRVESCLVASGAKARYRHILSIMTQRGVSVYSADDEIIEDVIGFRFHRGIMAVGCCPKKITLSGFLKDRQNPRILVALNAVNDPENVGLIVRNAAAFGAGALIVDAATYDPYYRKAVRVSMGTVFGLPVCYEKDLAPSLVWLKKDRGARIIAAMPGRGAKDIAVTDLSGCVCIVFGNEDKGISRGVLNIADEKVRIPISKTVDSLNVTAASAIFLYAVSARNALTAGGVS